MSAVFSMEFLHFFDPSSQVLEVVKISKKSYLKNWYLWILYFLSRMFLPTPWTLKGLGQNIPKYGQQVHKDYSCGQLQIGFSWILTFLFVCLLPMLQIYIDNGSPEIHWMPQNPNISKTVILGLWLTTLSTLIESLTPSPSLEL